MFGPFEQREESAGDEVARRIAAGVDEQHEEQVELHVAELAPVEFVVEQHAREVVLRIRALLVDDALRVREHLETGLHLGLGADGLGRGVECLRQLVEFAAVLARKT